MRNAVRTIAACGLAAVTVIVADAREGMFTPDQLPAIASDLREAGLELDPDKLAHLTAFPSAAVVSLGGCSASFVSPKGLITCRTGPSTTCPCPQRGSTTATS